MPPSAAASRVPVDLVPRLEDVVPAIVRAAKPGDVVITLGAGSIGSVPDKLVAALARPRRRLVSAVAAQTDRRFRRAHVKPARRKRSWRALAAPLLLWIGAAAALVFGGYRASALAAHVHVLQVERIVVRGNERLSKGEILAVLNGLRGESLMRTDLDRWRTRLLASPWVRDAALRRSLPSTVEVVVSERQPIGIGRIGGEMYLVDERGVVIDQYGPQYADLDLPIIDGLSARAAAGR